ncbi:MAG: hypothetical protein GX879_01290, partial [Bacteroidales bacterium]|nr:hypothetical protein [Bacteroidales bacterium]
MKRILLLTVFAAFVCYVHAQVVYKRSDYLHANDEIPVVTYSNTDGITGMLMSDFITEEGETVFTNFSFEQYIEETLTFPDPYLYDEDEDFTNSTLVAFNDMGFAEFRKVNWDKVRIVGFKGELPMLGNMVSVFPEQALEIMYFPTNEGDEFSNTGLYSRKLAISEFQDMIPAEYYDVFAALYDSVKMVIEVELNSNYVENMQINIEHDFNYNSTRNVLKEIRSEYRSINVYI